jgi:hypothetical protein
MAWPVMVLTRAWPTRERAESFDRWQLTKHIPEAITAPGRLGAAYYRSLETVPPAFCAVGVRMAVYGATTLEELFKSMDSPQLKAALADGIKWFDAFHRLDGQEFTGNVYYECQRLGADHRWDGDHAVLVDRWEMTHDRDQVISRLGEDYLPLMASIDGVESVLSFEPAEKQSPVAFYRSPGRFMVWTRFTSPKHLQAALATGSVESCHRSLAGLTEDVPYATHEAYEFVFERHPDLSR